MMVKFMQLLQLLLLMHSAVALRCGLGGSRAVVSAAGRRGEFAMKMDVPKDERVAVVLLAGGSGSRMKVPINARPRASALRRLLGRPPQANMPKQFLELNGRPVLQHSLELLSKVQQVPAGRVTPAPS